MACTVVAGEDVLLRAVLSGRSGGVFLLEAYRPEQLQYGTGGPPTTEMMMDLNGLRVELAGLELEYAADVLRDIREGRLHTGQGAVVQVLARKPVAKSHSEIYSR
jgi:hypothetical protein